tara:strand:+ start:1136 stop:1948 length:813 start_codon:yes stop_codon:yes gene_type:complete
MITIKKTLCPNGTVENSDASYSLAVPSGTTQAIIDSTVNVNTVNEGSVVSVKDIDVSITDGTSPVTPDSVVIVGNAVTITVPAGGTSLSTAKLMKTGQTISYRTGDDGFLQEGRATDFLTLAENNPFGDTFRFTDELGGQTFTNDIVIDWSTYDGATVLGWYKGAFPLENWNDAIDNSLILSVATFTSGWRIPNVYEAFSITNIVMNGVWNYAPFNNTTLTVCWTSSTVVSSTSSAYGSWSNGLNTARGKTNNSYSFRCRTFTVTGTTLS